MKQLTICCIMCVCMTNTQAQFLKNLKSKVEQSAKEVETKVKKKAETTPDRVIDHAATKVDAKAETKIDNKENKANSKVDKTVDKVDSVKLKKSPAREVKDSLPGNASLKQSTAIMKNDSATYATVISHSFNDTIFLFASKPKQVFKNEFYNNKKHQA